MGVWTKIVQGLKWVQPENPVYQEKVNERKKQIEEELGDLRFDLPSLTRVYIEARAEKDDFEKQEYQIKLTLEAASQLLADRYEIDDVSSVKLDTGDAVRVEVAPVAVVKDKEMVRQWCLAQGFEREMTLPWQTLNALMKDRMRKGDEPPPGVEPFRKNKIVLTKGQ